MFISKMLVNPITNLTLKNIIINPMYFDYDAAINSTMHVPREQDCSGAL